MGMFYGEYVVFISMTIDTEYNQDEDRTYFNARLSIDYNDMEEIIEGSILGNDISGAELEAIIVVVKEHLYENRKVSLSILNINNDKLEQILTRYKFVRQVKPSNIVLDERQAQLIKLAKNKNLKIHVKRYPH